MCVNGEDNNSFIERRRRCFETSPRDSERTEGACENLFYLSNMDKKHWQIDEQTTSI